MKTHFLLGALAKSCAGTLLLLFASCSEPINTNFNPHFTEDGTYIPDTTATVFQRTTPRNVKFYVEVSGSMNGYFRPNRATHFKQDLWRILTYYAPITNGVTILTNEGNEGSTIAIKDFQSLMNSGAFISSASTKVPLMLETICQGLEADSGEVAVLASDMKYSPVGMASPEVLLTQYSTDISVILGRFGKSVSLVCATSNYLDRNGNDACPASPYYYLILGRQECVAEMRNVISTLLQMEGRFVDHIDTGFDYGRPRFKFGLSSLCEQMDDQPTFIDYEAADDVDTCTIKLKLDLSDYRWLLSEEEYFRKSFHVRAIYGSKVEVGKIKIDVKPIVDKTLKRQARAEVELKVPSMPMDSDVLEWTLSLDSIDTNYSRFAPYLLGATEENDPSKSYSVEGFITGMFHGGLINRELKPNYILISKKH